ncbi:hypothetical protein MOSE0_G07954 [Monosporozyma servazzii]
MDKREWTDGITHTAKSFKNWDSCMADKPCKIIAIVGIVLASILGIWLVGSLLTCLRQGFSGIGGFICWCCHSGNSGSGSGSSQPGQQYAAQPPNVVYQPVEPAGYYQRAASTAKHQGEEPQYYSEASASAHRSSVFELEQDFDLEAQKQKSRGYFH